MQIYYRLCDIQSTNPSPVYQEDKLTLNERCLSSFINEYSKIDDKIHITYICDYCNHNHTAYNEMINKLTPEKWSKSILFTEIGINNSCLKQYELFEQSEQDIVLFQECDYFHINPLTESIVRQLGFVSPYDHPDKYDLKEQSIIRIVDNHHFKDTISTTSTFATTRELFDKHKDTFYKFGYIDHERWVEITRVDKLYTPIPTFATHMVKNSLSPGVEWINLFSQL